MHIYQNSSSGTIILFSSNLQYKIVFLVNPPLLILERSIRKIIFQKKNLVWWLLAHLESQVGEYRTNWWVYGSKEKWTNQNYYFKEQQTNITSTWKKYISHDEKHNLNHQRSQHITWNLFTLVKYLLTPSSFNSTAIYAQKKMQTFLPYFTSVFKSFSHLHLHQLMISFS